MIRRKIFMSMLATAAMVLAVASTAYACVVIKGTGTVTAPTRDSSTMTGSGGPNSAEFCPGNGPTQAAAGGAGATVGFTVASATSCNTSGTNKLSEGTYDVRLRNVSGTTATAWKGSDASASWTQVSGSGCFAPLNVGKANNYDLGNLTVGSTGSGSGSWTLPSTGLVTNNGTVDDASIFCVGKLGPAGEAPTASSDGFLAPFRVSTV